VKIEELDVSTIGELAEEAATHPAAFWQTVVRLKLPTLKTSTGRLMERKHLPAIIAELQRHEMAKRKPV
jgi:hypothetical protein